MDSQSTSQLERSMRYLAVTTMLVSSWLFPIAKGQESTARLLGTITDPTGAVIPRATITARNVATGVESKTFSSESGDYSIQGLAIGQYAVIAEAAGFRT